MSGYNSDEENNNPLHAFQGHRGFGGPAAPGGSALGNLFGTGLGGGARGGSAFGAFGGFGPHHHMMNPAPAPPSAFHHTYRAYSAAIFEIQHGRGNAGASVIDGGRAQVMFGGQIIMPTSALRELNELEIDGPWTFELVNPSDRQIRTHAGVLEFGADEGVVYLPSWMMKRLKLSEGESIQLFGTRLPKGKFVKLQPQSVTFLELSDPKAVLEQALRAYTVISPGDIIEIHYNMMTFELLVMEVQPDAAGISVLNTDLEVDFAPPVGYVEPERKPAAPVPTMQSKLNINISEMQDVDARGSGTSTPVGKSRLSTPAGTDASSDQHQQQPSKSKPQQPFEAFRGTGQSLAGKRIKGKGISAKPIQPLEGNSKIWRTTDIPKIVTADTQIGARKVPAALNLPEGTLFFGYQFKPPVSDDEKNAKDEKPKGPTFTGAGGSLLARRPNKNNNKPSKSTSSSRKASSIDAIEIDSD